MCVCVYVIVCASVCVSLYISFVKNFAPTDSLSLFLFFFELYFFVKKLKRDNMAYSFVYNQIIVHSTKKK